MKFCIIIMLVVVAVQAKNVQKYNPNNINVIPRKLPRIDLKIVGGSEATPHSFPHAVALYIDGRSFCGGSIIREDFILTAAHCVDSARHVEVVAGAHNLNKNEPTQQRRTSSIFIVHEDWDRGTIANDIALIRLNSPLNLTDDKVVKAVQIDGGDCLGSELDNIPGTVAGWGRNSDSSGSISPVLRYVTSEIMQNSACRSYFNIIQDSNICLDGSKGKSTCNGDSGSALLATRSGSIVEVGLSSYGSAFGCEIGYPSAYTRVSCFKDWINDKL